MREAASFISSQCADAPANALQGLLRALQGAYRAYQRRSQLIRLTEVDDHLLADIGVTREDVRWALDQPFASDPGLELQRRALRNSRRGWRD